MAFAFETIGIIRSCFKEKFGIPRQPGLAPDARAVLELRPPFSRIENLQGLEGFSHVWVLYVFHAAPAHPHKSKVRPPRLGGNRRVGVFASRSCFRPNPIGLSVCELERLEIAGGHGRLLLRGVDILDQTPVIDLKPYLPYADALPEARPGLAPDPPAPILNVHFSAAAAAVLLSLPPAQRRELRRLIDQVLRLDPRPAYQKRRAPRPLYGVRLARWDVRWTLCPEGIRVNDLVPVADD